MDPSSTYLLDVRIMGKTCRPEFPGGFSFKWPIDADVTNFKDFLGDICEKYPWALNETVCLHYIHASSKELIPICKDQDLTAMFECFHHTKRGKVVITLGNQINLSQAIVPCTPSLSVPSQAFFTQEGSTSQASKSDAYLENPFPHYEHVGVDDEKQYSVGIDDSSSESDDSSSESDDSIAETDNVPEVEGGDDLSITDSDDEEWIARDAQADPVIPQVAYDKENPPMTVETIYPSMCEFRLAVAQYSIKKEFEFFVKKTDPSRFRARCIKEGCGWRLHASTIHGGPAVQVCVTLMCYIAYFVIFLSNCIFFLFQIKVHEMYHGCLSTRKSEKVRNAKRAWVCDKVMGWLREDASVGAMELRRRIKDTHKVTIPYKRVHSGRELAMSKLYGDWDSSFDKLYGWKAEIEKRSPGSIVAIDHMTFKDKKRFTRLFVALHPCIQGFLGGCRPYLAIDSTHLTGKYRGQLATACAIDGHNWLYPVAYGIIDSETSETWLWFMEKLHEAIGEPAGLSICSDAGKGIDYAIEEVFGYAEHRECMRHLVSNFKLKFHGKVFEEHLWPAAYAWTPTEFDEHMASIGEVKSEAIAYLKAHHKRYLF